MALSRTRQAAMFLLLCVVVMVLFIRLDQGEAMSGDENRSRHHSKEKLATAKVEHQRKHDKPRGFFMSPTLSTDNSALTAIRMGEMFGLWPLPNPDPGCRSPLLQSAKELRLLVRGQTGSPSVDESIYHQDVVFNWRPHERELIYNPKRTAILVVDVWDGHWCLPSQIVSNIIAPRINVFIKKARSLGVQIVHCPSEVVSTYYNARPEYAKFRERLERVAATGRKTYRNVTDGVRHPPPGVGGCPSNTSKTMRHMNRAGQTYVWKTKQHDAIEIMDPDVISDDGYRISSYLWAMGIDRLIYVGVHLNECVTVSRTFSMFKMKLRGFKDTAIARDLTDVLFDPRTPPLMNHDEAFLHVVNWAERGLGALTFDSRCFVNYPNEGKGEE